MRLLPAGGNDRAQRPRFCHTDAEKTAAWKMVDDLKLLIDAQYAPQGYNIGVNVGEAAGQTISHAHLHLIPRYLGDTQKPRGGVRGVIPEKQSY